MSAQACDGATTGPVGAGWKRHIRASCIRKIAYLTCGRAVAAMARVGARPDQEPYQCQLCDHWHWGSPTGWPPFPPEVISEWRPKIGAMRLQDTRRRRRDQLGEANAAGQPREGMG